LGAAARKPARASASIWDRHVWNDSAKPCSSSTSGAPSGPSISVSKARPGAVSILRSVAMWMEFLAGRPAWHRPARRSRTIDGSGAARPPAAQPAPHQPAEHDEDRQPRQQRRREIDERSERIERRDAEVAHGMLERREVEAGDFRDATVIGDVD